MTIQAIQSTTPNLTTSPKRAVKTGTLLSAVHFSSRSLLSHVKHRSLKQDKDVFELNGNNNPVNPEEELEENQEEENLGFLATVENGLQKGADLLNKLFVNK